MLDNRQLALCNHILQRERLNYDGEPYRQGRRSTVFFASRKGKKIAVKIFHSQIDFEKEIFRLHYAGALDLVSAEVPKLLSYRRFPSYIMMSRLSGQTCRQKWEGAVKPTRAERDEIGTALGLFLAELYRKTLKFHGDLNPGNLMTDDERRLKVLDWGKRLKRSPIPAFRDLLLTEANFAPKAAQAFTAATGIAINADSVATCGLVCKPDYGAMIARNLAEWKEMVPQVEPSATTGQKNYLTGLLGRRRTSQVAHDH